jgi:DNA-binding NarL/FixJ family response regulator
MSPRVVLGDEDERARRDVRELLEGEGFAVVGEAPSTAVALAIAGELRPDVVLVDLPAGTMQTLRELAATAPEVAIVVLTDSRAEADVLGALRAGARGYLQKSHGLGRLGATLRGVLAGEAAVPRTLMSAVLAELQHREPGRHRVGAANIRLTERESQVLDLLARGVPTGRIAEELFVSAGTVRTHIAALMHKLGADSRDDAIRLVTGSEPDQAAPFRNLNTRHRTAVVNPPRD